MAEAVARPRPGSGPAGVPPESPHIGVLTGLGESVYWPDLDTGARVRDALPAGLGRLRDLAEWLGAVQGRWPLAIPQRPRMLVVGEASDVVASAADAAGVNLSVETPPTPAPADAVTAGIHLADRAADSGCDLLVLADDDVSADVAVVVGALTGAEPVTLLPRGAAAVDTMRWIARARRLRDAHRRVTALRGRPDDLLEAVDAPALALSTGIALQSAVRRTPVVLAGTSAVVAGLVCSAVAPGSAAWFQVADRSPDPVHARAVREIDARPVLDLGMQWEHTGVAGTAGTTGTAARGTAAGLAGLLALAVVTAAARAAQGLTTPVTDEEERTW